MLQSMGSQRVGHDLATEQQQQDICFVNLDKSHDSTFLGLSCLLVVNNQSYFFLETTCIPIAVWTQGGITCRGSPPSKKAWQASSGRKENALISHSLLLLLHFLSFLKGTSFQHFSLSPFWVPQRHEMHPFHCSGCPKEILKAARTENPEEAFICRLASAVSIMAAGPLASAGARGERGPQSENIHGPPCRPPLGPELTRPWIRPLSPHPWSEHYLISCAQLKAW